MQVNGVPLLGTTHEEIMYPQEEVNGPGCLGNRHVHAHPLGGLVIECSGLFN